MGNIHKSVMHWKISWSPESYSEAKQAADLFLSMFHFGVELIFGDFFSFFYMLVNLEIVLISNVTGLALKLDKGL